MGFDPRRWRPSPGARPITANVEALLAENEALRREVRALRQLLDQLLDQRHDQRGDQRQDQRRDQRWEGGQRRVTTSPEPGITSLMVDRWCQAMAHHPGWASLRLGPPGGLRGLVDELRRHWWNPSLSLEQELDRQMPGLGGALAAALRGPHSRGRWAVRAAFALYGPRAIEWLSEEPLRVVEELRQRVDWLDRQRARRGTRTANHSEPPGASAAGASRSASTAGGGDAPGSRSAEASGASSASGAKAKGGSGRSGASSSQDPAVRTPPDPRHQEALRLLGLEPGASPQTIKRAFRRLAKAHHPDLGGDAEAFHRLDAAYRLLLR